MENNLISVDELKSLYFKDESKLFSKTSKKQDFHIKSNNKQTMHPKTQHHERITPAKATTFALTKRVISYRYQYFRKTAD